MYKNESHKQGLTIKCVRRCGVSVTSILQKAGKLKVMPSPLQASLATITVHKIYDILNAHAQVLTTGCSVLQLGQNSLAHSGC